MSQNQTDIGTFFNYTTADNPNQCSLRSNYQAMYYTIDGIPTMAGAEKSVAKRKLLESMDAALRAAA
jgi:hypothetical protein